MTFFKELDSNQSSIVVKANFVVCLVMLIRIIGVVIDS